MLPSTEPLLPERLLTGVRPHNGDIHLLEDGLELPRGHEGVLAPACDPAPCARGRELLRLRQTDGRHLGGHLPVQVNRQSQQRQIIVQRAREKSLVEENVTENN